jgi:small subunit ribosomal protein S16
MVKIRLRRVGAKKQPSYRLVVADSRSPRDGRFIETIGHYNPRTDPPTVVIHEDRALYWLSVGAQPSESVARFFQHLGLSTKVKEVHAGKEVSEVAGGRVQVSGPEPKAATAPVAPKTTKAPKAAEAPEAKADDVPAAVAEVAPAAKADDTATSEVAEAPAAKAEDSPTAKAAEAPKAKTEDAPAAKAEPEPAADAPAEPVAAKAKATEPLATEPTAAKTKATEPAAEEPAAAEETKAAKSTATKTASGALATLELSSRVEKSLETAGVKTVADLQKLVAQGDDALLAVSGIGAKAVEEIHGQLEAKG